MALSSSQKQKIKSMSSMVSNTRKMADDMAATNRIHALDLQSAFDKVSSHAGSPVGNSKVVEIDPISSLSVSSNRDFLNKRKLGQRPEKPNRKSTVEPEQVSTNETPSAPPKEKWFKNLYRKIAVQTHPDKVQGKKWSAIKKEKYVQIGMSASDAYSNDDFSGLILAGIEIDVYSSDISSREQLGILDSDYSKQIKQIDSIQASIAWRWGAFWNSPKDRVAIVQHLCATSGFQPPPPDQIEEILKKMDFID
mgnify:CR=1 FL=1